MSLKMCDNRVITTICNSGGENRKNFLVRKLEITINRFPIIEKLNV